MQEARHSDMQAAIFLQKIRFCYGNFHFLIVEYNLLKKSYKEFLFMNYLFFDIEGASPKLCTIATFGYVLSDENFNIIEKEDILMDPDSKYDWYVAKNLLSYSKQTLAAQPKFDERYNRIRSLLASEDTLVCGFSIANDLKYLNSECVRYSLPPLDFRFLDVQMLVDAYFESKNQIGIERAYTMLEIDDDVILHRSDEDALASLKVAKKVCELKGETLTSLSKIYACTGVNKALAFSFDQKQER